MMMPSEAVAVVAVAGALKRKVSIMEYKAKKTNIDVDEEDLGNDLLQSRSRLVRIPRGADSTIFGGWGVKI